LLKLFCIIYLFFIGKEKFKNLLLCAVWLIYLIFLSNRALKRNFPWVTRMTFSLSRTYKITECFGLLSWYSQIQKQAPPLLAYIKKKMFVKINTLLKLYILKHICSIFIEYVNIWIYIANKKIENYKKIKWLIGIYT